MERPIRDAGPEGGDDHGDAGHGGGKGRAIVKLANDDGDVGMGRKIGGNFVGGADVEHDMVKRINVDRASSNFDTGGACSTENEEFVHAGAKESECRLDPLM